MDTCAACKASVPYDQMRLHVITCRHGGSSAHSLPPDAAQLQAWWAHRFVLLANILGATKELAEPCDSCWPLVKASMSMCDCRCHGARSQRYETVNQAIREFLALEWTPALGTEAAPYVGLS